MLHEVLAELLHLARTPHLHQVASGALREQEVELVEIDETVVPVPLNLVCNNARGMTILNPGLLKSLRNTL